MPIPDLYNQQLLTHGNPPYNPWPDEFAKQKANLYATLLNSIPGMPGQSQDQQVSAATNWLSPLSGVAGSIKTFHGSPYLFSKFLKEVIGSGEGAAAFGHGLYTAEQPYVARHYQQRVPLINLYKAADDHGLADGYFSDTLAELLQIPEITVPQAKLLKELYKEDNLGYDYLGQSLSELKNLRQAKENYDISPELQDAVYNLGNLYELELRRTNPSVEDGSPLSTTHFLDWNKPYAQQSPWVKASLYGENFKAGKDFYKSLGIPAQASKELLNSRISGIRYLNGQKNGHNLVVFDPENIHIQSINGTSYSENLRRYKDLEAEIDSFKKSLGK